MIVYKNKEFRNLQEQVKKNMDDISFILQEEGVLNEFGIKVVGQEASVLDMPTVEDYKENNPEWSYGDAYAIGTEEPYELYILTRANGTHPNDYWFNIGEFPAPGPQGPEGPQGEVGPQGPTGNTGADGVSPVVGVGTVSTYTLDPGTPAYASVFMTGTQANPSVNYNFYIPRGQDGSAITAVEWGQISGTLTDQADLVSALQAKANVSALASYATQVYANNVASNATYQANVYTDSAISALSSIYMTEAAVGDYLTDNEYAKIDEIPTDTSDLTNNAGFITNSALSGYATQSWVSSNFLSIGTPIGGAAEWGSISGTLSNQTDLMSKFSEYATVSSLSSAISGLSSVYASISALSDYATVSALSSAISAVEAEIPDIRGLASETYVDDSISALSSVYAPIGDYATNSALSSAISGVNSTISSLNYLSVGAMSSETYIPRVGGDNDGTYWTAITLGDDTYSIPQGGISSIAWGNIGGTLSDQTDLQTALDSKVNKEVTSGNESSLIDINETLIGLYVNGLGENDEPVDSYLETSKDGVVIQANNEEGQSTQLIVENNAVNLYRDSDEAQVELFSLADDLSTAQRDITDIQDSLSGFASISYVDDSISALSSVYAPLSDYASQSWVSANFLSSGYVPVISGYAELSGSNRFTSDNLFTSSVMIGYSDNKAGYIYNNAGTAIGSYGLLGITVRNHVQGTYKGLTIAASNGAITPIGGAYFYGVATSSELSSAIDSLSSVYAPINYLPSGVSGYASEVWTFTLSDNTTVSKTVLVG